MRFLVVAGALYHIYASLLVPTMNNAGTAKKPRLVPSSGDSLLVFVEVFPFEYYQFWKPDPKAITQYWRARGDTIPINHPTERRVYHFLRATAWRKVVINGQTQYIIGEPMKELKTPQ